MMKKLWLFFILVGVLIITACSPNPKITGSITIDRPINQESLGTSFLATENKLCLQDGKPIIREFATSWCPHCAWVKETFQQVVKEYEGKIIAYQWEVDTGNDLLSEELEVKVPQEELDLFKQFNPQQSIPTFIMGCKYYRIGNAYEAQNNKEAEKAEFKAIIEKVLGEVEQV